MLSSSTTPLMLLSTQMQHEQHNCVKPPLVSTQHFGFYLHGKLQNLNFSHASSLLKFHMQGKWKLKQISTVWSQHTCVWTIRLFIEEVLANRCLFSPTQRLINIVPRLSFEKNESNYLTRTTGWAQSEADNLLTKAAGPRMSSVS